MAQPPSSIAIVASASRPMSWDFGYDGPTAGGVPPRSAVSQAKVLDFGPGRGGGRARDLGAVLEGERPVAELDLLAAFGPDCG